MIVLKIGKNIVDLDKTFNCGQCFNWTKIDGSWYGFIWDTAVELNWVSSEGNDEGYLTCISLNDDVKFEDLKSYLDLDTDYSFNKEKLTKYELNCINRSSGLRILRQDPIETMFTFVVSQRSSMSRIRTCMNRLRSYIGEVVSFNGQVMYKFPEIEKLVELSEEDYKRIGIGYRSEYLVNLSKFLVENKDFVEKLDEENYPKLIKDLKSLKGIGDKVANCIALFGFHRLGAFPVDVHIQNIIDREYDGNIDVSRFGGMAGLMQQYMFYNENF